MGIFRLFNKIEDFNFNSGKAETILMRFGEDIVIFDVSMRTPGSPGTMFTPYSGYLYHKPISVGERIAMEIKKAVNENKLDLICT